MAFASGEVNWEVIHPQSNQNSVGFFANEDDGFVCESVSCADKPLKTSIFHFVFGLGHNSTFPLLVNRICEVYQECIKPRNILITMHSTATDLNELKSLPNFQAADTFLRAVGAPYAIDNRVFTANNKMMISLEQLYGIYDKKKLIYHSDLDEVPDTQQLYKALGELQRDECDAIKGQWRERVAIDGSPTDIVLSKSKSLKQQFPYSCEISAAYMPIRTTWKVLVYRSYFRLVSGQHDIWCNVPNRGIPYSNRTWDASGACRAHIRARVDKSTALKDILFRIPKPKAMPRYCPTVVTINHFKFVSGVVEELKRRADSYKNLSLAWWTQSYNIVKHIEGNFGKLCVNCDKFKCRKARDQ